MRERSVGTQIPGAGVGQNIMAEQHRDGPQVATDATAATKYPEFHHFALNANVLSQLLPLIRPVKLAEYDLGHLIRGVCADYDISAMLLCGAFRPHHRIHGVACQSVSAADSGTVVAPRIYLVEADTNKLLFNQVPASMAVTIRRSAA